MTAPEDATSAHAGRLLRGLSWDKFRPTATSAVAAPRVMATTSGSLFVAGGVLVALLLLNGGPAAGVDRTRLAIEVAVAVVTGVGLLISGHRLPTWSYHVLVVMGTVLIGLAVAAAGGGLHSLALTALYVFVAVDAFFFFPWWLASAHLVFAIGSAVLALSWVKGGHPGDLVVVCGVQVVVGPIIGWLVRAAAAAEIDPLTGLPNRRGFDRELGQVLARAERTGAPLALALVDVDDFKTINDLGGHTAGDRLLREAAASWRGRLPPGGCLARLGGDEFAVLLPGHDPDQAVALVESLRDCLPSRRTCSVGVALWERGDTASLLVNRADSLLYQSKRSGRNRTTAQARRGVVPSQLQEALKHGQLRAVYQPIVTLGTGRLVGVEALVRWQHPERGWVEPSEFIPLAEETGLIGAIDAWMLRQACGRAALWVRDGVLDKVTVNVSGCELVDPGYAARTRGILAGTGLAPRHLVLEITESTLDSDTAEVVRTLGELREMGVRIAIDDFGTGFSSLSRLDLLPVDILKIDRSFVAAIQSGFGDSPLVAAVVALGHALGLTLVAEGVEDVYQRKLLVELGCDEGQGYLFGHPVPPDAIPRLHLPLPPIPAPRVTVRDGDGPPARVRGRRGPRDLSGQAPEVPDR